ncbi:MAG: helix-turn-helix transcriptional regulator [Cyanobacteria bacterium]|nr:helix-turn-helix transcriptional regulator [Cyanobacteriota bacterium]MDA0866124.1 helix-turn-helix transcriptional regulator [Cyanobacteriota bacterium]
MKTGSKYYPLYEYLRQQERGEITVAISAIEALITGTLPKSAWTQKAWWSNRSRGALQATAWISAGYHTHAINFEQQHVTFRPFQAEYRVQQIDGEILWEADAVKALRQHLHLTQAKFAETLGVRRQTVSEWENGVYAPDRSTAKHLGLVATQAEFQPPSPDSSLANPPMSPSEPPAQY